MENKKSFVLYNDYIKHIEKLSDEEAGQLFKALFHYSEQNEVPCLSPRADMAFSFISEQLQRDAEKYEKKCARNRESIQKRWQKEKNEAVAKNATVQDTNEQNTQNTQKSNYYIYPKRNKSHFFYYRIDIAIISKVIYYTIPIGYQQ